MSPINNINNTTIHWILNDDSEIMIVDDFQYDDNFEVIVPDDNFSWIDIYGLSHTMVSRDGMPPLVNVDDNGVVNYYW